MKHNLKNNNTYMSWPQIQIPTFVQLNWKLFQP